MGFATITVDGFGNVKGDLLDIGKTLASRAADRAVAAGMPMLQAQLERAQPKIQKTLAERAKAAVPEFARAAAPYLAVAAGGAILLLALGRASSR